MNILNRKSIVWKGKTVNLVNILCSHSNIVFIFLGSKSIEKFIKSFATFNLSHDHACLQKTCKDFANKELRPIAADIDKEKRY